MKGSLKRNAAFIAVLAVIMVLCTSFVGITLSARNAEASGEFSEMGSVSVGHITDMHYYPFRLCYTEGNPVQTDDEYYFYNYIQSKSTKMWLEAETIFDKTLDAFLEHTPEYIVVSGDVGQDGELLSHIDVANKLRRLQNAVRSKQGNDAFQIFVIMGNHDLYNEDTFRFDNDKGIRVTDYYTSRLEMVQIYAGLGFPNMTDAESRVFYAPLSQDLPTGYTYIRSDLSSKFFYTWEFLKDEDKKAPTYTVGDDNRDTLTIPNFLKEDKLKLIDNSPYFSKTEMSYSYTNFQYGMDFDLGHTTYIAVHKDKKFTCIGMDVVQSNAEERHVLGGQLHNSTQDWMMRNREFANWNGKETVMIGIAHHSILPHWNMEEEITTGFIVYNWVEVSDFLADYGMRFVYTGHMHANDTVSKVSFNGNQIIDMETSASVSVGSQMKITNISYGQAGGRYAEKAFLSSYKNMDVTVEKLYNKVLKNDKYGYVAANGLSSFIDANTKKITNYSKYAQRRIYDNVVSNYIAEFLKPEITAKLGGLVEGIKPIKLGPMSLELAQFKSDVVQLADNLISEVNKKVLKDYTYSGNTERYKAADMKLFGFLEEMVLDLLNDPVADDLGIFTVFMDCYMRHCTGEDWAQVTDMPKGYQNVLKEVLNGNFVGTLFDKLLDRETGLMKIIEGLATTNLDLSSELTDSFSGIIGSVMKLLNYEAVVGEEFSFKKFNLGTILKVAGQSALVKDLIDGIGFHIDLANMTLPEIVDDIVAKYLTDNFKQGLGEYAYRIATGFGTDGGHIDVHDDNGGKGTLIVINKGDAYTYLDKPKAEIITVENGKLPSMLTNNFGSDPATTRRFTYFTDRRVTDGEIEYMEFKDGDSMDSIDKKSIRTVAATTKIYGTTKPLIDLGIWCQSGYLELSRHTIALSGLKPGTTYAYRVGSPSKDYYGEWHTFTTGTADGAFSALITSDLQSSTQSAYQRMDKIYTDVLEKEFKGGTSFLINPGDVVDNSRNLSQFRWLLDSSASVYASNAMVVSPGNHDNKYFELDKASNVDYYGGVSEKAVTKKYNYLWSHYNYDLTANQTQLSGFYYSFDYSKVHFAVLNTNDIDEKNQLGEEQFNWLVEDLKTSKADYKVVVMHKSLYSEGSHSYDPDVVGMRKQLTSVFADNGVNLVLAGHDHTYNETFYLDKDGSKIFTNANSKNEISKKGTLYITMGTFGEKFYNYVDNPEVPTSTGAFYHKDGKLADPVFGKLTYQDGKLYYYGYQYVRNMEDMNLVSGDINPMKKSIDFSLVIAFSIAAITVLATAIAIVCVAVKNKKN